MSSSSSSSPTTPTTFTTPTSLQPQPRPRPRQLAFTPPRLPLSQSQSPSSFPSNISVSRLHVTPAPVPVSVPLPLPVSVPSSQPHSPSPFMKEFAATVQPPPNAVHAICPSSSSSTTTCPFWKTKAINDVRRARILPLALLTATATAIVILLLSTSFTSFLSANILLLRDRFQHEQSHSRSFARIPMPMPTLPSVPAQFHLHSHLNLHPHHRRDSIAPRQQATSTLSTNSNSTTKPTPTSSSATSTPLAIAPAIPTQSPPLPTPFPQPFDETLTGSAFLSGSCQQFFTAFTNDIDFRSCRAFSFLYAASEDFLDMLGPDATGFAKVTDPLQALTDVLWGVCNTTTDQATCASRMSDYEQQLQRACQTEISQEQPLAVTALNGFRNFNLMRTAACMANQRTNSYCFVDAIAASLNGAPSDIYFYQLPLGTPLPGTNTEQGIKLSATCSTCVRSLMDLYSQYLPLASGGGGLNNGTDLLIQNTYPDASAFVSKQCGTGYASTVSLSSAAPAHVAAQWGIAPLLLCVIGILFVQREPW